MLTLEWHSRDDGLAFFEEDGQTYHIRPPWTEPTKVANSMTSRAGDAGFDGVHKEFATLSELVSYLRDAAAEVAAKRPPETPEDRERLIAFIQEMRARRV